MMKKKPASKKEREIEVLMGLVELFLTTGKPVGSNTLRENGFELLSSATIRNYFASLESSGYLIQEHTSGGRSPTDLALRLYVETLLEKKLIPKIDKQDYEFLQSIISKETKRLSYYLQEVTESIADLTSLTTLITAPRFDQDFISRIILSKIDDGRAVCIIVTDFGFIHTETLYLPGQLSSFPIHKLQAYFHFRLTSLDKPSLTEEEEVFAKSAYDEVILRHFISFTNMNHPDIYKGGFAKLLRHSEFHDPKTLSNTLSLFENSAILQHLLYNNQGLKLHIGEDLKEHIPPPYKSSLIQIPYYIHNKAVGNIAVAGPSRMNYKELISLLETISALLSDNLTKSLYKFQLNYRTPKSKEVTYTNSGLPVIGLTHKESV